MQDEQGRWGGRIERGVVTAIREGAEGGTRCDVRSFDRPGVTAKSLPCPFGLFPAGSKVFFFLFPDGTGMVLGMIA